MSPNQRAAVLRQRFTTLFPFAVKHVASAKPKKPRPPAESKTARRIDFSLPGSISVKEPVKWMDKADPLKPLTVAPMKRRKGQLPLTIISDKLQPGSPELAMRRRFG